MPLMKCVYLLASNTRMLFHTKRHSLNQILNLFGKFILLAKFFSIVMEYADDGDLFQRICDHQ